MAMNCFVFNADNVPYACVLLKFSFSRSLFNANSKYLMAFYLIATMIWLCLEKSQLAVLSASFIDAWIPLFLKLDG